MKNLGYKSGPARSKARSIFCGIACALLSVASPLDAEPARRAFDFVDSIGVNIKCPSWDNYRSNYANTALVEKLLVELGVRHYRANAKDVDADWTFFRRLNIEHGLQADLLHIEHYFPQFGERLREEPGFVKYVEGINEMDPPRSVRANWSYRGQPCPAGLFQFQNEIYHAVKADAATRSIPVITPSVSRHEHQADLAGIDGDRQNIHSYPAGNRPTHLLEDAIKASDKVFTTPKLIVATETGYSTATAAGAVSERAKTKYTPRLVAEYWNNPRIERLYFYELIDTGGDAHEFEHGFGFARPDGTIKPSFTALQSLIRLLDDSPSRFRPEDLNFEIKGDSSGTVRHTVLQKRNGDFYLLLWRDVSVYDGASKSDVNSADIAVSVSLDRAPERAVVYRYGDSGYFTSSSASIQDRSIRIDVPDTVSVLQITLSPAAASRAVDTP